MRLNQLNLMDGFSPQPDKPNQALDFPIQHHPRRLAGIIKRSEDWSYQW